MFYFMVAYEPSLMLGPHGPHCNPLLRASALAVTEEIRKIISTHLSPLPQQTCKRNYSSMDLNGACYSECQQCKQPGVKFTNTLPVHPHSIFSINSFPLNQSIKSPNGA